MSPQRLNPTATAFMPDVAQNANFQDDRYRRLMSGMATGLGAVGWDLEDALSFDYFAYRPIASGENEYSSENIRAAAKATKLLAECRKVPEITGRCDSAATFMAHIMEDFPWSYGGSYTVAMRTSIYQQARRVLAALKDLGGKFHEFNNRIQTCPGFAEFQKYDASRLIGQETPLRDLIAAEWHWPWHALKKNPKTSVHMMKWYQRVFFAASYDTIVLESAAPKFVFAQGYRRMIDPGMDMANAARYEMAIAKIMIKRILADCAPETHVMHQWDEQLVETYLTVIRDYRQERVMHGEDATVMPPWDTQAETQRDPERAGLLTRQDLFPFHGTKGPQAIEYVGLQVDSKHAVNAGEEDVSAIRDKLGRDPGAYGLAEQRRGSQPEDWGPHHDIEYPRDQTYHSESRRFAPVESGFVRKDPANTRTQARGNGRYFDNSSNDTTPTPTPRPQLGGRGCLRMLDSSPFMPKTMNRSYIQHAGPAAARQEEERSMGAEGLSRRRPSFEDCADLRGSNVAPIGSEVQLYQREGRHSLEDLRSKHSPVLIAHSQQAPSTPARRGDCSEQSSASRSMSQYSTYPAFSPGSIGTQTTHSSDLLGHTSGASHTYAHALDGPSSGGAGHGRGNRQGTRFVDSPTRARSSIERSGVSTIGGALVPFDSENESEDEFILGPWAYRR